MPQLITLATCSLNQWAMDFKGNQSRIIESIRRAKNGGANLRVGPELELSGYGCLDHFLEEDTEMHCWDSLAEIIAHPECQDIIVDIGTIVKHKNVAYNCRVVFYNKKILFIRPKLYLANDGNYREMRYFTQWKGVRVVEVYDLPSVITKVTDQKTTPIGDTTLSLLDTVIGIETCEELFTPQSPHISMSLDGVEIFTNSSGSHHELRKLNKRIELIKAATARVGGVYLYANQKGCDGDRLYYDGSSMIVVNGEVVCQGKQFSLDEVEVLVATVDLSTVRSYRNTKSRGMQARETEQYQRVICDMALSKEDEDLNPFLRPSKSIEFKYHVPEEEIALGPACYLWDYLRRSRQAGYFIPLSGGIDSCATSMIVCSMTKLVFEAVQKGENPQVLEDLQRISGRPDWVPESAQEIAGSLFHTAYMGMSKNSSPDTRKRAKDLAKEIGAYHLDFDIDNVAESVISLFKTVTSFSPQYLMHGGTWASNLALQNVQARLRMVLSYLFAQLLPTVRGVKTTGSLLVLSSANVDESLRGYLTKYDCSSGDINPIGAISKADLKSFLAWACKEWNMPQLQTFLDAPPTAELLPITDEFVQDDETDMGGTYHELGVFGRLRKISKLGPYSAFVTLVHEWGNVLSPTEVYDRVKWFFRNYSINRHKLTTLTPALHLESYSPDDNRFDLRPFLYPSFDHAYDKIEKTLKAMGSAATKKPEQRQAQDKKSN